MRALILVAGAALALSACGGGNNEANEVDTISADNLVVDGNFDSMNGLDGNAMTDMNATGDSDVANAMMEDATTNDADTNLANGL